MASFTEVLDIKCLAFDLNAKSMSVLNPLLSFFVEKVFLAIQQMECIDASLAIIATETK